MLNGHTQALNADFIAQTLLLSDQLQVSETFAASLLQAGMAASARWARTPTEVACLLYYRERLALLACWKEIARAAYTLRASELPAELRVGARLEHLLDDLAGDAFVPRVLAELDALRAEREHVRAAMQSAAAGGARLSDEIQLERGAWIEQEAQELGHLLYLLAIAGRVSAAAAEAMLAWLSRATAAPGAPAMSVYVLTAVLAVLDTAGPLRDDAGFVERARRALDTPWALDGLRHVTSLQFALFLATHGRLDASLDDAHELAARAITADSESALVFLLLRVLAFRHGPSDLVDDARLGAVDAEFQEYVLQQVERLLLGLTSTLLPLVRRLQRAEEDAAFASLRAARPGVVPPARRFDTEALFDLVAQLCRGRPESGLPFWIAPDGRVSRFLLFAVDTREAGQQRALFSMLAALAEGEQCAAHTHALLEHDAGRLVSWARLFDWIAHYVDAYAAHAGAMPPEEMVLLHAFLGVLETVVRHSAAARDALYLHKAYMAVPRLFALYHCAVPVDLKAALLGALGAFATSHSPRIVGDLWTRLEQGPPARAAYELEHVEAVHCRYPGSTALVRFLTAVLPEVPGGGAYLAFVLDDVFLRAAQRTYAQPAERWAVCAACIEFLERCLATYAPATTPAAHPGAEVLRRVLSGSPLLRELLFFLHPDPAAAGFEAVNGDRAQTPEYARAVRGVLAMLLRILELQPAFFHAALPAQGAPSSAAYVPLDVHLLHAHQMVVQMALYVNCVDADIALLALRLVRAIARSATFQATDAFGPLRARTAMNRLVGVLEMTGETTRVVAGVLAWLEADDVRLHRALLDLLLENTAPGAPAPNVAHLLLGFDLDARADDRLVDAASGALLRALVTRVQPGGIALPPALAERCLAVLQQLCEAPYTSASVLRFLRTHEVALAQLRALALRPLSAHDDDEALRGTASYASGECVATTADALLAHLRTHAHVAALVALEMHLLALHGQLPRATPLLALLLGAHAVDGAPPHGRLWELLRATHVTWDDDVPALPRAAVAALAPARLPDAATGPKVYDLAAVAALLAAERGAAGDDVTTWQARAQTVVAWAAAENTRRAVAAARRAALAAWRRVLGTVLHDALATVRPDARVPLLLDALAALVPRLADASDAHVPDLAARGVLAVLHALRRVVVSAPAPAPALPGDRIVSAVRALLDVLAQTSAAARSDLYLALVCVLELAGAGTPLASRVHTLLAAHAEALVDTAARDALDGSDIVQTVALTTLARLAALERVPVGDVLASRGYLRSLALRVQELDAPLQDTLGADPASLNAQYVYEALMALFLRLVPRHAPQMLDARVIEVLARVDFPSLRPERGTELEGFLPPVAERYAALLTPLLQVLVALLVYARGARAAILALLLAHQDALLAVLRSAARDGTSLGDVEQAALLVVVLAHVSRAADEPAGLAPFRAAVLTLAARFLGDGACDAVQPSTAAEADDTRVLAPTANGLIQYGTDARATLFEVRVRTAVDHVARATTLFLERCAGEHMVLVPSMHVGAADSASAATRVVTAPTLGLAIRALSTQLAALGTALQSLERVDALLRAPDAVSADEWVDIARDCAGVALGAAPPSACRAAAECELRTAAVQLRAVTEAKIDTVERLLVLLVRHVAHVRTAPAPTAARAALDTSALHQAVQHALQPVLDDQLAFLDMSPATVPGAAEHVAFLHMAARRLAELLLAP